MKKVKILQLTTIILFAITVLITITGLYLIWFSNFYFKFDNNEQCHSNFKDGYTMLKHFGLSYTISTSASSFCNLSHISDNYYPWIQLQIGVIFCIIIVPILLYTVFLFVVIIFVFKIREKNNNFWDAIENCEIINNYYVH
ncbi:hypothetical protein [Spiroplasma ixodetis]|uniref:hypothetical protein n=1 Tax=Spiroplasma ixodetis TaxID=2141 RepID=UPI0025788080|nr:hypothetical protein [Spiroplasma ixodetis]WJG70847.1 hypothetical protein SIXOD_v1c21160 [Spiroplasma ixodetis Y32]